MNKITKTFIFLFLLSVVFSSIFACGDVNTKKAETGDTTKSFTLTSSSFTDDNGVINNKHLGPNVGENKSPPLAWENPPTGTRYFYILMQDAQSTNWKHWLIELESTIRNIKEGYTPETDIEKWSGYYGPTPPENTGTHTYTITIYAVDKEITIGDNDDTVAAKRKLDADNLGKASISGTAAYKTNP